MPDVPVRELVSNDYCRVTFDPAAMIVRFARTNVSIRSIEEAGRLFGQAVLAIDGVGRSKIGLILDMRDAPMRNDPQYEAAMAEYRRQVARSVPRVAVIVRTAVGKLHAQRLGKQDHLAQVVVSTDQEALEYLTSRT